MDSPPIPLSPVDENDPSQTSLWNSIKRLHRGALVGLVLSLVVGSALGFCVSAPLWRPIGALVLQRLWDVLRFLVITTSIVLALLNSRHPRRSTNRLDSGKDDSFSSKLPFVAMFHGEVQQQQQLHSYSFNSDKEVEVTDDGRKSKTEITDGYHENEVRNSTVPAMADNFRANDGSSKIMHRRGKSLEFPMVQEEGTFVPCNDAVTEVHTADTQEKRVSVQQQAALSTASAAPRHGKHRRGTSSSATIAGPGHEQGDTDAPGGMVRDGAAFKHSRSRSAYSLDELLLQQQQQRPRSKPGTAISRSSQLSKRRNVSLSCDLDREYTKSHGVPPWLSSVPSPPTPPLIYSGDSESNRGGEGDRDESSLKKAYTESLAPWRAAANTVPVGISTEKRKEAAAPSSDPATPVSMGSPSPRELNKKVDAFISRFHERMRLQRLESIERAKVRGI